MEKHKEEYLNVIKKIRYGKLDYDTYTKDMSKKEREYFDKLFDEYKGNKFLEFLVSNIKGMIFILVVLILFYVPTGYEIDSDGGLINLYDRIEVTPSYEMKGSINSTYVGGKRGTIAALIASKFIDTWDAYKVSEVKIGDETYAEQLKRGKVYLKQAFENAKVVALKEAGYDVKINSYDLTVIYIDKKADTDLKVGDIIKEVDGVLVETNIDAAEKIGSHDLYDKISLKVFRDGKEIDCYAIMHEEEGKKLIGILINPVVEASYSEDISIKINSKSNEYGSSGGVMNALLIYNKLTSEDITKGDIISGTGELNLDGTIKDIAGVKYKLRGAYKAHANVFIVPSGNYEEAKEIKEKYNMDIELIEASNFSDVVKSLKERK